MNLLRVTDREDGVRVLSARGELDAMVAPAIIPRVAALVEGARGVVLDLSAVTFFDSSGVRLVDRLARECARTGARFRVIAPPDNPSRRVLELVGMAGSVVVDDMQDALASVRPTG